MAGTRLNIDFFFKDMTPRQVNTKLPNLLPAIREAKAKASKINEGLANEEMTVRATYRICHHDEGVNHPPCEPEVEI